MTNLTLVHHSELSGIKEVYSLSNRNGSESVLSEYICGISSEKEQAATFARIIRLANDKIQKNNSVVYHGFPDFGRPPIYVLKAPSKSHRYYHVYDTDPRNGRQIIIFIYCYAKKTDKVTKQEKNKIMAARDFYFENNNKFRIIESA